MPPALAALGMGGAAGAGAAGAATAGTAAATGAGTLGTGVTAAGLGSGAIGTGMTGAGMAGSALPGVVAAPVAAAPTGMAALAPYMQQAQQGMQIYDMIKPNGSLQRGDISEIGQGIGAAGKLGSSLSGGGLDKLPDDVKKALMALIGK